MKDPAFTVVGGDVMPFTWGMGVQVLLLWRLNLVKPM